MPKIVTVAHEASHDLVPLNSHSSQAASLLFLEPSLTLGLCTTSPLPGMLPHCCHHSLPSGLFLNGTCSVKPLLGTISRIVLHTQHFLSSSLLYFSELSLISISHTAYLLFLFILCLAPRWGRALYSLFTAYLLCQEQGLTPSRHGINTCKMNE